jgi:hypothetical protein
MADLGKIQKGEKMKKYLIAMLVLVIGFALAVEFPCIPGAESTPGAGQVETDQIEMKPLVSHEPAWKTLEKMSQEERENSEIELVLEANATDQALQIARNIENLWNNGSFEQALALFPKLEELTDINEMAIGNTWRTPVPTEEQPDWGADVRIGNRDNIYVNAFDIQRSSGNLFAILLYPEGSTYYWSVNFSTNGGSSWSETYTWAATYPINWISASVLYYHCYVVFSRGVNQDQALLYRFKASDGSRENFNNGSTYITIHTLPSGEIEEVALTAYADGSGNRLYYFALASDGVLHFFWDDSSATSWTGIATNVTDADRGLDACCNQYYSTYFVLASYINTSDQVKVDGHSASSWDNLITYDVNSSSTDYSAVGAYHDTLLTAFDFGGASNLYIRYLTSYNGGSTWYWGRFDDTTTIQESPDVALRYGGGAGVIYRFYTPTRELRYTWRNYSGGWSSPVATTEYAPYYNKPCIEYLGSSVFGIVYLCWSSPYSQAAYFTRSDWTGIVENKTENTVSRFISLAPNPSRGIAKLSYIVKTEGDVRITLFDAAGRTVSTLVNEIKSAGKYTFTIDNENLAAGIYFVRVETPDGVNTKAMTVIR